MTTTKIIRNGINIASVRSAAPVLTDVQSALDLMADVQYNFDCDRIAINKEAVAEDFFVLSTRLAGDILQKFSNYGKKLAIYGDFSRYTSKPLRDFIYESNTGRDIFFTQDESSALDKLSEA